MHCHDVLGITETASLTEIEEGYSKKAQVLISSCERMSEDAYALKMNELETAQTECTSWCARSNPDRMRLRMQQAKPQSKRPTRLYSVYFGPCTFTDMCCGEVRDYSCGLSSPSDSTCCEGITGSQTCPIVCDVIFWAPIAIWLIQSIWSIILPLCEAIIEAIKNHHNARIEKEISELWSQLEEVEQKRGKLEKQLGRESELLTYVSAFAAAFTSMGVGDAAAITNMQKVKVQELCRQISECRDKERELQGKIQTKKLKI